MRYENNEDAFYKLKQGIKDKPLIAEIKVRKGQAILTFDKFNIFDNPFLSKNADNNWLRINYTLNKKTKTKIEKIKCVLEAQGHPFKSEEYPLQKLLLMDGGWKYYTHRLIGAAGDEFGVKVYG